MTRRWGIVESPRRRNPLAHPRRGIVIGLVAVTATASVLGAVLGTSHAVASAPQIAGSVAAPTASEVSPICQAPSPAADLGPAQTLPSDPTSTVVTPPGGVVNFAATSTDLYVDTGSQMITYSLSGTQVAAFTLPSGVTGSVNMTQPVIDPNGNIYLASYYGQKLDKFSPTGTLLWSVDPAGGIPTSLFSIGTGASFQLAVGLGSSGTDLINLSTGAVSGTFPLLDNFGYVTQEADGNLLFASNGYVETVSPSGTVLSDFGSNPNPSTPVHTGSGTQFTYTGQAVQGPDGTIYTADPLNTIESTSPQGYLEGSTTLGQNSYGGDILTMAGDNFYLVGSTFYYQGGAPFNDPADNIQSISMATLQAYLDGPHEPTNSLGWGAGLSASATANYFAPGTTPSITANFDPWWTSQASHLQLSYSVENNASMTAETVPTATTIALPTSAGGLADIPLTIPPQDQLPGPYEVQASLFDTTESPPALVGTTCMPYTVGATGDGLNFSTLPAGIGGGGPTDSRGVALNAQLGLDGLRGQTIDWGTFLPDCSASSPTTATCGPSAMTFASASTDPFKAAYEAKADHLAYWLQASGGSTGSVPMAIVNGGWWQADITKLVSYYATPPAGCGPCAGVTMWEPWNESNNTGWGNAAQYVTDVLQPFYAAVKSVEPGTSSTVIGGSSLDVVVPWWQQLITAGGLKYMDVAAIHPYTGNNDAFEEYGNVPEIQQLEGLLGATPLWFTEVGWWDDGPYNFLGQADSVTRAMIWQKVLNIPVWNYFFDEGNWGNDGVSFSLIQTNAGDDYVKPAALATMSTSSELAGRPYVAMPTTGIPQTYEATFGPATGGNTQLAAVWSDGLGNTASVTVTAPGNGAVPVTVTSEYGDATSVSAASGTAYSLPVSDQVTYLSYPVGDTLAIGPTQSYGTNLATTGAGASASATSGSASGAISGSVTGSGWTSAAGDTTPSLTVTLPGVSTINRVVVDTQSNGSTATSLRNYTVSVNEPGTGWTTVATEVGQFRTHELQLAFAPMAASQVRVTVTEIDFGGYYGGGIPPFWSPTSPGSAFLHALQVYAGTGSVDQIDGSSLTPLIPGGSGPPPTTTTTTTTTDPSTTTTTVPPTTTTTVPPTTTTTTDPPTTTTTTTTVPPTTTTTTTVPPTTTTTTTPPPSSSPGVGSPQKRLHSFDGYWLTTADGGIFTFGNVSFFGSAGSLTLDEPVVGMAPTPNGQGYWLVASDGGVFTFGDAGFYGSAGGLDLNKPIVGMATTPDGKGYWLVASDGGIFSFGDARFYGSTGSLQLNRPITHMIATPDGEGYWMVASDGGIFSFGDASFYGSTGSMQLNKPIVGMASTADGGGYWLVASDGGIFTFGDAQFYGSTGSLALVKPIVGMATTPDGKGYWLVGSDGGIFSFGDATFFGSTGGINLNRPAVAIS
ncbi:MAG: discoidin domain-containing protein [Acidimicrobiales bacterium]